MSFLGLALPSPPRLRYTNRINMSGIIRSARRPPGWVAPGPAPAGDQGRPHLLPGEDEDLCHLTGDWRIFQKQRGHRWSLDDLLTAHTAFAHAEELRADSFLDLGCGLGSVLLMMAWRFPQARVVGVEAQADRAAMGRRSIEWNGASERCRIVDGDLREALLFASSTRFPLITATPPYFPMGTGTLSQKSHAAACRFEARGGVEAYLEAATRWLSLDGRLVICTAALEEKRLLDAAKDQGLFPLEHLQVIPKEGKKPLVMIDVFGRSSSPTVVRSLTIRDGTGQWTDVFQSIRETMGFPPRQFLPGPTRQNIQSG